MEPQQSDDVADLFKAESSPDRWLTVARLADLREGQGRAIEVKGRLIALFRLADRVYAIDDCCPHMGAPLSDGRVEEDIVHCGWHGWRFRVTDGVWVDSPRTKVACYPVQVVGELVQMAIDW